MHVAVPEKAADQRSQPFGVLRAPRVDHLHEPAAQVFRIPLVLRLVRKEAPQVGHAAEDGNLPEKGGEQRVAQRRENPAEALELRLKILYAHLLHRKSESVQSLPVHHQEPPQEDLRQNLFRHPGQVENGIPPGREIGDAHLAALAARRPLITTAFLPREIDR